MKIFLSSPGDVLPEKRAAFGVLKKLARQYSQFEKIEIFESTYFGSQAVPIPIQQQYPNPAEFDMVVCIVWNRMGTPLPESVATETGPLTLKGPGGETGLTGTEYEFAWALDGWRQNGKPILMVYRKKAPLDGARTSSESQAATDQLRKVEVFEQQFVTADRTFISARHSFHDEAEFIELFEPHARQHIKDWLKSNGHDEDAINTARPPVAWPNRCPFRGLERFEFEHAPVFCGRDRIVDAAVRRLRDAYANGCGFQMLLGPSGSGKSSLIQAGILPRLLNDTASRAFDLTDLRYRVALVSFGTEEPIADRLAAGLLDSTQHDIDHPVALPELAETWKSSTAFGTKIKEDPGFAAAEVRNCLLSLTDGLRADKRLSNHSEVRLVLMLDQFEQIFRADVPAADREAVIHAVDTLSRNGHVHVIAAIRDDFYSRVQKHPQLTQLKEDGSQLDVPPPTSAELDAILRDSAAAAGLAFEATESGGDLADRIAADTAGQTNVLPLLELTLQKLYLADCTAARSRAAVARVLAETHDRASNVLKIATYDEHGGLTGVVESVAADLEQDLSEAELAAHPIVFWKLIGTNGETSDESRSISRTVPLSAFSTDSPEAGFASKCIVSRLFTVSKTGIDSTIRLAHETLVESWPLLKNWIASNQENLPARERLIAASDRWQRANGPTDLLLPSGKPLAEAHQLVADRIPLSDNDRQFIERSTEQSRFRHRLKRTAILSLVALTILSGCLAVYALNKADQAKMATQAAIDNADAALGSEVDRAFAIIEAASTASFREREIVDRALRADDWPTVFATSIDAERNAAESEKQIEETLSRLVTAQRLLGSRSFAEELQTLREMSADSELFVKEEYWQTFQARLLRQYPTPLRTRDLGTQIQQVKLSPDRTRILVVSATASRGHLATVWELNNLHPTECTVSIEQVLEEPDVAWSADSGKVIVARHEQVDLLNTALSVFTSDKIVPNGATTIECYSASSGKLLKEWSHGGLVESMYPVADDRIVVVDHCIGSVNTRMQHIAASRSKRSADIPDSGSQAILYSLSANVDPVTVSFDGYIDASDYSNDILAVALRRLIQSDQTDSDSLQVTTEITTWVPSEPGVEMTVVASTKNTAPLVAFDATGDLLVGPGTTRGFRLWQRGPDGAFQLVTEFSDDLQPSGFRPIVQRAKDFAYILAPSQTGMSDSAPNRQFAARSAATFYLVNLPQKTVSPLYTVPVRQGVVAASMSESVKIATGDAKGIIQTYKILTRNQSSPAMKLPARTVGVDYISDDLLLSASTDGQLRIWKLNENALGENLNTGAISAIADRTSGIEDPQTRTRYSKFANVAVQWDARTPKKVTIALDGNEKAELPVVDAPDDVLFSPNGRFLAMLHGVAPQKGVIFELPPLLQPPGRNLLDVDQQLIPRTGHVEVYELLNEPRLVSETPIEGPIVGAFLNDAELIFASLNSTWDSGLIHATRLDDGTTKPVFISSRPFVADEANSNHGILGFLTRDCQAFAFDRSTGTAQNLLEPQGSDLADRFRYFARVGMDVSGRYLLTVAAGDSNDVTLFDRVSGTATPLLNLPDSFTPIVARHPSRPLFYVGTGAGEILWIDPVELVVSHRESLGSRIVAIDTNADGNSVAFVSEGGVVAVRDAVRGFVETTDNPIPFGNSAIMQDSNSWYWRPQFDENGDLAIGEKSYVLLSSGERDKARYSVTEAVELLQNESPYRKVKRGQLQFVADLDWVDAVSLASTDSLRKTVYQSLFAVHRAESIPDERAARRYAIDQLRHGVDFHNSKWCLIGQEFLESDKRYLSLSVSHLTQFLRNRWNFEPDSVLAIFGEVNETKHPILSSPIELSQLKQAVARSEAATGNYRRAADILDDVCRQPAFTVFEPTMREKFAPFRTEQAILSMAAGNESQDVLEPLASYARQQVPSIAVGHRWLEFLLQEKPQAEPISDAGNDDVGIFLRLYDALARDDAEEALEHAEQLISASPASYIFGPGRPALPLTKAHAYLIRGLVPGRNKTVDASVDRQAAEIAWNDFVDSATAQGIDARTLWLWEVSYRRLRRRLSR